CRPGIRIRFCRKFSPECRAPFRGGGPGAAALASKGAAYPARDRESESAAQRKLPAESRPSEKLLRGRQGRQAVQSPDARAETSAPADPGRRYTNSSASRVLTVSICIRPRLFSHLARACEKRVGLKCQLAGSSAKDFVSNHFLHRAPCKARTRKKRNYPATSY